MSQDQIDLAIKQIKISLGNDICSGSVIANGTPAFAPGELFRALNHLVRTGFLKPVYLNGGSKFFKLAEPLSAEYLKGINLAKSCQTVPFPCHYETLQGWQDYIETHIKNPHCQVQVETA